MLIAPRAQALAPKTDFASAKGPRVSEPNVPGGFRSPWISVGVLVASVAWAGVSIGFSVYLSNFNSYNVFYGSIGAVIILMMWLYLSVWSVLLGGAINAELDARMRMRAARR